VAATASAEVRYVPVVAQIQGADGSYWNTELWVANLSSAAGTYALTFLPSDSDNTDALLDTPATESLAPGQTVYLKDVVPPRSRGALRVVCSDGVTVACRLYNAQGRGSVGVMVPALTSDELVPPGLSGTLVPLLRSPRARTNVGLLNPSTDPIEVRAVVRDPSGAQVATVTYALQPGSHTQINDVLLGFDIVRSEGHQMALEGSGRFAAYASVVDSHTGSPTLVLPVVR
jgi:hypothetical protein